MPLEKLGFGRWFPKLVRKTKSGNCCRHGALQLGANLCLVQRGESIVYSQYSDYFRHSYLRFVVGSSFAGSLHPFVADIEEPAWPTLVCLGGGLELDVPVYQSMNPLD